MKARAALLIALWLAPDAARALEPQCKFPAAWTRVQENRGRSGGPLSPLGIAADPSVLNDGGTYKLWFTNSDSQGHTGVAYAQGGDGIAWSPWKAPAHPDPTMDLVLSPPPLSWDEPGIETADVIKLPTAGYRLYFTGNHKPEGSQTYSIGAADSADGVNWVHRPAPVLAPAADWESPVCQNRFDANTCSHGGVLEPSVLYDAKASLYKMWYVGLGTLRGTYLTYRIGYATSPDGVAWARRAAPVLDLGSGAAWDSMWTSQVNVIQDPKVGYHMFYFGSRLSDYSDGAEMQKGSIGHAYSVDGVAWQRDPANPIVRPNPAYEAWTVGGPSAIIENGKIRLWYSGNPTSGLASKIILAEAPCGP